MNRKRLKILIPPASQNNKYSNLDLQRQGRLKNLIELSVEKEESSNEKNIQRNLNDGDCVDTPEICVQIENIFSGKENYPPASEQEVEKKVQTHPGQMTDQVTSATIQKQSIPLIILRGDSAAVTHIGLEDSTINDPNIQSSCIPDDDNYNTMGQYINIQSDDVLAQPAQIEITYQDNTYTPTINDPNIQSSCIPDDDNYNTMGQYINIQSDDDVLAQPAQIEITDQDNTYTPTINDPNIHPSCIPDDDNYNTMGQCINIQSDDGVLAEPVQIEVGLDLVRINDPCLMSDDSNHGSVSSATPTLASSALSSANMNRENDNPNQDPSFIPDDLNHSSVSSASSALSSANMNRENDNPNQDPSFIPDDSNHSSVSSASSALSVTNLIQENVDDHNMNEARKRRKQAEPLKWKRNENKQLRMEGKEYLGFSTDVNKKIVQNIPRGPRELKPTCTKATCLKSKQRYCSKFTDDERKQIFERFWKTTWEQRKAFIISHVVKINKKKVTVTGRDSRRNFTLEYSLDNGKNEGSKQVCREMFLNTLGLGYRMVQCWVNKGEYNIPDNEKDNRSTPNRTQHNHRLEQLKTFIDSLPKLPSHYGRKDSSKLYLEPIFRNIADVYRLYEEKCKDFGTEPLGRKKFSEKLEKENIAVYPNKKDQCNTCSKYKVGNITEDEWKQHTKNKDDARAEKEKDKAIAMAGTQICLQVDVEAVKLAPFTYANAFYFKTKLACHNYTVYNVATKDAMCYWFSEDQNNQLVASTYASCLLDYLKRYCLTDEKKNIIIFSDGCAPQNRNNVLSNALLNFSIEHNVQITQKYLDVGHTQMEVDSVHACIERKLKNREIKLPSDYVSVTKEARIHPRPYGALILEYNFFKDYSKSLRYSSIRPGKKVNDPTVLDIKAILYDSSGIIKVKLGHTLDWIDLPIRAKQMPPIKHYPPLHRARCKIPKSKWEDLQELKTVIPADCHNFYDTLPHM